MATKKKKTGKVTALFRTGAVSLAFLIIGYQAALFMGKASVLRIQEKRDSPDTVFVYPSDDGWSSEDCSPGLGEASGHRTVPAGNRYIRKNSEHSPAVEAVRRSTRKVESFRFNPNTASSDELQRLGFSEKQAQAILNYRSKGGRFRRKADFAKSFVVADSVFKRLEPFIDIPKIDINKADSAAFDELPGIGGYFARKMVEYRTRLGGYSCTEQLMEIYNFDREKYDGLKDLISCSPAPAFALWSLPAEELRKHPHIKDWQTAKAIVLFRENSPADSLSVDALERAGVLDASAAAGLRKCRIAPPVSP